LVSCSSLEDEDVGPGAGTAGQRFNTGFTRGLSRKEFVPVRKISAIVFFLLMGISPAAARNAAVSLQYQSPFLSVGLAPNQPALTSIAVDSLGKNRPIVNPLWPPSPPDRKYQVRRVGSKFEYRAAGTSNHSAPAWTFEFSAKQIRLHSSYLPEHPPEPIVLNFDSYDHHPTLLGLMNDDSSVRLPALLHLPDAGTFRITSSADKNISLPYDARRFFDWSPNLVYKENHKAYVKITIPAATASLPEVDYTFDVVSIYPKVAGIENDPRFDAFRRDWLNIFQLSPHRHMLANHAASDACAFTVFFYSSMAEKTPPLADGLTAMDLVRQTLDRYLVGGHGYGMADGSDPQNPVSSTDTYPSLLIAASDYVRVTGDETWLRKNYPLLKEWASRILAMDRDGSGLISDIANGNAGTFEHRQYLKHTSNWWDNIGFGHYDAYGNALAYHALVEMAETAKRAGDLEGARLYSGRAEKLKSVYFSTFYDPATGVLAGWKSEDGKLHDYYFTFVNGVAITYGLIPRDKANSIMDHMLAKMKEVGYTRFDFGLPGNLIPIRHEDYMVQNPRWGAPQKEDGTDTFGIYCNGGATGVFVYYTLQALYQLGRKQDADAILFPLLRGYDQGGFQGHGPNGMTYDWKAWDGAPHGYEGMLVDNYQALLAVLSR
jgi:hypothetical protein